MDTLKSSEKINIENAFCAFIKKESLFFKEGGTYPNSNEKYEIFIKAISDIISYDNLKSQLIEDYLWCDKVTQQSIQKGFRIEYCDFYFKFIRESQDILSAEESAFLLKRKLVTLTSNVINELIGLNNNDVTKSFLNHNFLVPNLDIFTKNYSRFSFTHEDDKVFFDILENTVEFKVDGFRNQVYKLVKTKFANPDFFMEKFPSVLKSEDSDLFKLNVLPSCYLSVDKKDLYNFNLMREYPEEEIVFFLDRVLSKIHACGNLFGISGYMFPEESSMSEDVFFICFYGEKDKDLKIDLLHNVFNKYIKSVLSENTLRGAMDQVRSGIILEKIILEESVSGTTLEHKRHKI